MCIVFIGQLGALSALGMQYICMVQYENTMTIIMILTVFALVNLQRTKTILSTFCLMNILLFLYYSRKQKREMELDTGRGKDT